MNNNDPSMRMQRNLIGESSPEKGNAMNYQAENLGSFAPHENYPMDRRTLRRTNSQPDDFKVLDKQA